MSRKTVKSGIKEIEKAYTSNRKKWINKYGSDAGYNSWFTKQVTRNKK